MARHGSHSNEDKPSRQTIDGQTTGSQTKTGNPAAANPPSVTRNKNSDPFRDAVEQGIQDGVERVNKHTKHVLTYSIATFVAIVVVCVAVFGVMSVRPRRKCAR